MIRKIFRQSSITYNQQGNRHSHLIKYLSLRESLNPQAQAQTQRQVQELEQKYDLTGSQLYQLLRLFSVDMNQYSQNYDYETFKYEKYNMTGKYRRSQFYSPSLELNQSVEKYKEMYPEAIQLLTNPSQDKKNALKDLQNIFLSQQINFSNLKEASFSSRQQEIYKKRIQQHIGELKAKHVLQADTVNQIEELLFSLLEKFNTNAPIQYGRIASFIQVLSNYSTGQLTHVTEQSNDNKLISENTYSLKLEESLSKEQLLDVSNIDLRDRQLLAEESTQRQLQNSKYHVMPWIDNKKVVFEAEYQYSKYLLLGSVTSLLGLKLLDIFYYGDATYSEIFVVSSFALAAAFLTKRNIVKNKLNYLTQINLHKDGKNLDLVFYNGSGMSTMEQVPISSFKLFKSDQQVTINGKTQLISQFRQNDLLLNDSYYAEVNGQTVFVPFQYEGNYQALQNIFTGQNVDTAQL